MTSSKQKLDGKRVLVVEDELLVAMLIEDMLADIGCSILGPFNSVDKALNAALTEGFDLALLDVNIAGQMVYPVADVLTERQIPFLFLSGYGESAIPPDHPNWKVCCKPFRSRDLTEMLSATLCTAAS